MKKRETTIRGRCEHSVLVEMLYLDQIQQEEEKKRAQLHLQQCHECQKLFSDLQVQYGYIEKEIDKPVSNKALDLAKRVGRKDTKYGLVVCEPVDSKRASKNATAYKTRVLFTANGVKSERPNTLSEYQLASLPQDSIAIRAMTDNSCNQLLLYLWSPQHENFDGWELKISGETGKTTFSQAGASKIPLINIEDLNDKVIYFNERQNAFASGNRFTKSKSQIATL